MCSVIQLMGQLLQGALNHYLLNDMIESVPIVILRYTLSAFEEQTSLNFIKFHWVHLYVSFQSSFEAPIKTEVQVLQNNGLQLPVGHCSVSVTRRVYRCGIVTGAAFGWHTNVLDEKITPTAADCRQMILTRYITMDGQIHKLSNNEESKVLYTSRGEIVEEDGGCRGADFTRGEQQYWKMVETTEVSYYKIFSQNG